MTGTASPLIRPLRFLALATVPGAFGMAAPALADTQAGADVSVSGRIASNPFLQEVAVSSLSGSVHVDPWLRIIEERTRVELRGAFGANVYTRDQGTDTTAAGRLTASHEISSYVGISGGIGYRWSNASLHNYLLARDSAADEPPLPTAPLPDVTLGGRRTRTQSLDANLGLNVRPSERDQVSLALGAARSKFGSGIASDYDNLTASVGYSRRLSERTSITADVQVARANYLDTRTGDGTIITPQAGLEYQISQRLSVGFSAGASFGRTHRADGSIQKFTSFSGDVRLCNTGQRTVLCLSGGRTAQATAVGGIVTVTNASLSYDYQLGERDTLTLTGRYSKNDISTRQLGSANEFYGASATFARRFNRRISVFVNPSFSKLADKVTPRKANYQLEAGLRFRFGAI